MENLIFSGGAYRKELNNAINCGINEFISSKNIIKGNLDLSNAISSNCLKFFKWLLVNKDTCLELEDDYGLRLSGRSSIIEIDTDLWNDFPLASLIRN